MFLLTFQLFQIIKIVISKGVEWADVMLIMMDIALTFLPLSIPLSAFFATMYSLNHLSEDSEIVAMRSFGFSKNKLFLPFFICSLFIGAALFSLSRNIIPYAETQSRNTIIKLTSKGMISEIRPETFFRDVPNVLLFAKTVEDGGKKLGDIFIKFKKEDGKEENIIMSKEGSLVRYSEDESMPSLRLFLKNGNLIKIVEGKNDLEKILFDEYDFPLLDKNYHPEFITKDSMRSTNELNKVIQEKEDAILELEKKGPVDKGDNLITTLFRTKLEYWQRINNAFLVSCFVLLGFCFGIKKGRGKNRNTGGLALLSLLFYYGLLFFGIGLSRKGMIPPYMATLMPTFLTTLVGCYFYRQLDWQS